MKRFLFACILATTTCTFTTVQHAMAQSTYAYVSASAFTNEINLLDSYIAAGNMTAAQSTWDSVHVMMKSVLAYSKTSIQTAATPADKASYQAILKNQTSIYFTVWGLKTDLATNRTALHSNLVLFGATIY